MKLSLEYLPESPMSACALLPSFVHNQGSVQYAVMVVLMGQCVLGALVSIG